MMPQQSCIDKTLLRISRRPSTGSDSFVLDQSEIKLRIPIQDIDPINEPISRHRAPCRVTAPDVADGGT
jgi:hypothetical protein